MGHTGDSRSSLVSPSGPFAHMLLLLVGIGGCVPEKMLRRGVDFTLADREEIPHAHGQYGIPLIWVKPYAVPAPDILGRRLLSHQTPYAVPAPDIPLPHESRDHFIGHGAHHFDVKKLQVEQRSPDSTRGLHQLDPCLRVLVLDKSVHICDRAWWTILVSRGKAARTHVWLHGFPERDEERCNQIHFSLGVHLLPFIVIPLAPDLPHREGTCRIAFPVASSPHGIAIPSTLGES